MSGPLGTTTNTPEIDSGTHVRMPSKLPGIVNRTAASSDPPPFIIHLDLKELIKVEQPHSGKVSQSGSLKKVDVFVKGEVLGEDINRPKKVLAIVRKLFAPLADVIKIELDTQAGSDRLLRAHYGWPMMTQAGQLHISKKHGQFYDPSYVGVGAEGQSRSRSGKFKPVKGDANKGVSAYIFEGAIGILIMNYLGEKANVENIFATAIAHELGHNLGLPHSQSAGDIMFVFADKSESEQRNWVTAAEKSSLKFSTLQFTKIRKFLKK